MLSMRMKIRPSLEFSGSMNDFLSKNAVQFYFYHQLMENILNNST